MFCIVAILVQISVGFWTLNLFSSKRKTKFRVFHYKCINVLYMSIQYSTRNSRLSLLTYNV